MKNNLCAKIAWNHWEKISRQTDGYVLIVHTGYAQKLCYTDPGGLFQGCGSTF